MKRVSDLHVSGNVALPTPAALRGEIAAVDAHAELVAATRDTISAILSGSDPRFLVIVGPCSIHDLKAGQEYAARLAALSRELRDQLFLVMRVYFEKPRTSIGWKGLIMDPRLDGTNDIPTGLRLARTFLREVLTLGLPTATEMLDPITPQYIADLTCWSAIGARTVESQTHRQMASGLSMPVGFKNATSGAVAPAINGIKAAMQPQTFLGINEAGRASMVTTIGNRECHLVLRGGDRGPNHDAASVSSALAELEKGGLRPVVMVDASHANCGKDCAKMPDVFRTILRQRLAGVRGVIGAMLESNLVAGAQALSGSRESLVHGQSITDPCIDWETTEALLREAAATLRKG